MKGQIYMRRPIYKELFQSTAWASLSLLAAFPGLAQDAASIETGLDPVGSIRDYFGDNDPADDEFSDALTDAVSIGGMTADGSSFVGTVYRSYAQGIYSGFVWSDDSGVRPVGERDPDAPLNASQYYTARDISADGSVIVGKAAPGVSGGDYGQRAYRWTEAGGFEPLGSIEGNTNPFSEATAVSGDGNVIVGYVGATGGEAFRWTAAGGMESLGWLEGRESYGNDRATGASWDGSVIVGSALSDTSQFQSFRWTEEGGMVALPTLAAFTANRNTAGAAAISWDGTVIAGHSLLGYSNQAVRWVDGEIFSLGGLNGATSSLSMGRDISGDGLVIVGDVSGSGGRNSGFRWTEDDGMLTVEDWLRANGVTIIGSHPAEPERSDLTASADATNEDGSVIVGTTRDGSVYIARVTGTSDPGEDDDDEGTGDGDGGDDDTGDGDGDTGGGDGDTGEDEDGDTGGGGLITVTDLGASLGTSGVTNAATLSSLSLIVNGAGSRPLDRRVDEGRFTMWFGGDLASDNHGSRDGRIGLGEIGLGYNFGAVQLNTVLGYTGFDQNTFLGGSTEVRAGYVKLEMLGQISGDSERGLWGVLTGTGLWGDADISRNYRTNGGLIDSSFGHADVEGYGIRGRLQWENAAPNISPYGELSYAHTCLGGYTETGGAFPASFNRLCDNITEARLGVDASYALSDRFSLIGTLEGVHRFEDRGSNVTGNVIGLGAFDLGAAGYEQNWARALVGFEVDMGGSTLSVMGNTTTKGGSADNWIAANWRITF
ncbi:autotransporter domain-containing protein [Pseudogemmobacter humi]|nr:autotransporter domain-containing protein [Pseudogemmobacter humi]